MLQFIIGFMFGRMWNTGERKVNGYSLEEIQNNFSKESQKIWDENLTPNKEL